MSSPQIEKKSPRKRKQRSSAVQIHPKRLAPLPTAKSRKQARKITTLFHRYTRLKEETESIDKRTEIDSLIERIGGQKAYQRASQISTSYHSTSKWVLGCLAQNGWLYGIVDTCENDTTHCAKRRIVRRPTRILEIGAINTELIDAASTLCPVSKEVSVMESRKSQNKHCLEVRAIDLHAMHESIEQVDFLSLPVGNNDGTEERYDVVVCSMVLNCVPTPLKRGEMLLRIFHFLRPGGLVYIVLPKTCLNLSPYLDYEMFTKLLHDIGFQAVKNPKDTPKLAFFIGQKPMDSMTMSYDPKWTRIREIRCGRKYRNDFSILLPKDDPIF